ncbi:MAG: hypothetical protein ABJF50_08105 [Paracoccaceae bacterium]
MARVAFWLVMTGLGVAFFFGIFSSQDAFQVWLLDIGVPLPQGAWAMRVALLFVQVCVLLLVGAPFTMFLYSLAAAGSDDVGTSIEGYTELRLKSGARIMTILMVGFLLFVFMMAFGETDVLIIQVLCLIGALFFLWAGVWLLRLRLRFDCSTLIAPDYFGRTHRHAWQDLQRMSYNHEAMEYHLWFAGGKRARASVYLAGVDDLVGRAQDVLNT